MNQKSRSSVSEKEPRLNAGRVSRQAAPIQFGTENTRIRSIRAVSTPAQVQAELLLTEAAARTTLEAEGRQDIRLSDQMTYGQSVTDACISWDDTLEVLGELSGNVARRRGRPRSHRIESRSRTVGDTRT